MLMKFETCILFLNISDQLYYIRGFHELPFLILTLNSKIHLKYIKYKLILFFTCNKKIAIGSHGILANV